jgi:hypothetical protein
MSVLDPLMFGQSRARKPVVGTWIVASALLLALLATLLVLLAIMLVLRVRLEVLVVLLLELLQLSQVRVNQIAASQSHSHG